MKKRNPKPQNTFVSISLDICGSTKAKQTTPHFSLRTFYKRFIDIEIKFYEFLKMNGFDLNELYLVKAIGDELWYVAPDKNIHLLVDALQKASHESIGDYVPVGERQGPRLPIKCYIDFISNMSSHTKERSRDLLEYFKSESADVLNLRIERLNIAGGMSHKGSPIGVIKNIRYDPIGIDIDHFFRCREYALPGLITAGRRLFNKHFEGPKNQHLPFTSVRKDILRGDLKGIASGYSVYHLIGSHFPLINTPIIDIESDGLQPSRDMLIRNKYINWSWNNDSALFTPNLDKWLLYRQEQRAEAPRFT